MIGPAPMCAFCVHFNRFEPEGFTCKAFPKGIPEEIIEGIERHEAVREDQEGELVFEPRKDIEIPEEYR